MDNFASYLEAYSLEQLLEFNDLTTEEALEFMVEERFIAKLPKIKPLNFDD